VENDYLYDCLLPWQQSAIHSYERKRSPWCVANPQSEYQGLKTKGGSSSSFSALSRSSGEDIVNTVGSHLILQDSSFLRKILDFWLLAVFLRVKTMSAHNFNSDICNLALVHYADNSHHSRGGRTALIYKKVC